MADVVQQLESQCNTSSPCSYEAILSQYRTQFCNRPLRVLAPWKFQPWLGNEASRFEEKVSTPVHIAYEDPTVISSLVEKQLTDWAQQDLWIIDGSSLASLTYRQALLTLEQKVQDTPDISWPGFQELWANLTVVGGRTVAVPLSR